MQLSSQRREETPWLHAQDPLCCPFGWRCTWGPLLGDSETEAWKETWTRLRRQEQ